MALIILMAVSFFMCIKTGFGTKQDICQPFCTGSDCITVNQGRVDFKTAEDSCKVKNGVLMILRSQTDERILSILSQELLGNFWIGLHLPAGTCSNLSAPLRGYEWNSGSTHGSFVPSATTWKDSVQVCSPHCVSLSSDQKWTERVCSDKADGYLCRTRNKDACQTQELSDSNVFLSSQGCSTAPCEHTCTALKQGFKCSCFEGYIPDSKDPRRCQKYCGQPMCSMICLGNDDSSCSCADGYVRNINVCEDIDECAMGECSQKCENTYGGFVCSCNEGFVLRNKVECIRAPDSGTPTTEGFFKLANKNNTLKTSSAPIWIWIFVAVAVVVFIVAITFYIVKRQKRREQTYSQSTVTAPVDNIEC